MSPICGGVTRSPGPTAQQHRRPCHRCRRALLSAAQCCSPANSFSFSSVAGVGPCPAVPAPSSILATPRGDSATLLLLLLRHHHDDRFQLRQYHFCPHRRCRCRAPLRFGMRASHFWWQFAGLPWPLPSSSLLLSLFLLSSPLAPWLVFVVPVMDH
jgi:hypothetical protein